ncbi:MAG: DUF58 domain-containing protein [Chloroflexota bacterium]|nr:DUF58 domain-containing protein [Chloroflexota bacterium]
MTPARIFVLLMLLVGGVGTAVTGATVYIRILYLSILLILIAWLLAVPALRGVRVERSARSLRASVGDIFEEHFEVFNASRLPKLWLEVVNESPVPHATGSRVLTFLRGRQKRTYTARTWLTGRGGFPLGPTTLTSGDPFGIFRVSKSYPSTGSLVVLPMLFPISEFLTPPGLLPGGKAIRRKSLDITPHAAGIREYVSGDPMKRIHWPTSIRRGQLMVKEFEQDPQAEVWLFLDTNKNVHVARSEETTESYPVDDLLLLRRRKVKLAPSTLEYSISITASLASYFIERRRAVGFVSASGRSFKVIPAERSERQEAKILEELAFLQAESLYTLPWLVMAQMGQLPQGSTVILVTPMIWPELVLGVDSLQRRNLRPVVVLLMTHSFGSRTNNEDLAKSLEERKVPVCRVYCDADLSETLSSFAVNTFSQDMSWRKPVLSHLT